MVLHLAGIFHIGDSYRVVKERYYCTKAKNSSENKILEVRKEISEDMVTNSILLEIYRDNLEVAVQLKQKVKKVIAQTKREFRKRIERSQTLGRMKAK